MWRMSPRRSCCLASLSGLPSLRPCECWEMTMSTRNLLRCLAAAALVCSSLVASAAQATASDAPWHGRVRDLGTLGGSESIPVAINNRREVAGYSPTAAGHNHAFLWRRGVIKDLGTLGGATAAATAINDRGQVVGSSETRAGAQRAFLWQRDKLIDLGSLG